MKSCLTFFTLYTQVLPSTKFQKTLRSSLTGDLFDVVEYAGDYQKIT